MRGIGLAIAFACAATLAHAEDMAAAITKYRREHGLSAVKTDPQLTAIAERQAKAMAATGVMDHSVAGAFSSRIAGARTGAAAENIAAGQKNWPETFRAWQTSSGHNANLLLAKADSVGVAFARNDATKYKTYWAMVIADKSAKEPKKKAGKLAAADGGARPAEGGDGAAGVGLWGPKINLGGSENPFSAVKNFVCKYFC